MQQQSRVLQEFRAEVRPLWDETAARELNVRYLDIHADEDVVMLQRFNDQAQAMSLALVHLGSANQSFVTAEALSQSVHDHLELSQQEVEVTFQNYEQYRQYVSMAQDLFREVARLINEANSICKGVPTT
jgi:hypothetical protein